MPLNASPGHRNQLKHPGEADSGRPLTPEAPGVKSSGPRPIESDINHIEFEHKVDSLLD